jgi:acyl-CoA thioester hydrolase
VYEQVISVSTADLDAQGHVNNLVYVRWVLEIATAHWRALATPRMQAEIGWVLLRHEIDYRKPATLGERLTLRTRVGEVERLRVERLTEVRRCGDGQLVAASRAIWCPVDPATGRPRRVDDQLRVIFAEPGGEAAERAG